MAKGILVNSNLLNLHRSMILGGSLLLAFAGCQNITPQPTASTPAAETVTVRKSNDHRDYRYLMLQNKLKVLLVSDTKADKPPQHCLCIEAVFMNHRTDQDWRTF